MALRRVCRRLWATDGELARLPELPFVLAEVLHHERTHVFDVEQTLAGGVDGETAQVAGDPTTVQLFGDGSGCAGAAEAVEDQVVFVRRG